MEIINFKEQITRIKDLENFYFIELNNRRILANDTKIFDISEYDDVKKMMEVNGKRCALVYKGNTLYLMDIETKEVILSQLDAFDMQVNDKDTIEVMTLNSFSQLYSIDKKDYVTDSESTHFISNLYPGIYVLKDTLGNYYITNIDGKLIFDCGKSIPKYVDGNLVLIQETGIKIYHNVNFEEEKSYTITEIIKGMGVLTAPCWYKEDIVIVNNDNIEIINTNLNIIKRISVIIEGKVNDAKVVGDNLLILVDAKDKIVTYGVNLQTNSYVRYDEINALENQNETSLLVSTEFDNNVRFYQILDSNFKEIPNIDYKDHAFFNGMFEVKGLKANDYHIIPTAENLLIYFTNEDMKNYLYSLTSKKLRLANYTFINFKKKLNGKYENYGYAETEDGVYDFINSDGTTLFTGIDLYELGIKRGLREFTYYIINGYLCLVGQDETNNKCVIINSEGTIIYNEYVLNARQVCNAFEIEKENEVIIFNTLLNEFIVKNSGVINNVQKELVKVSPDTMMLLKKHYEI